MARGRGLRKGKRMRAAKQADLEFLLNDIHHANCFDLLSLIPDNSIDLIVTSPPYDNLRTYNGYHFDFMPLAHESYRVLKDGGVLVWIVGDATINGSETGTSFRQALYFRDVVGFNLHDTMIYQKYARFPDLNRYQNSFEYMFVLSKGIPHTFNPITKENKTYGRTINGTDRKRNGSMIVNPNFGEGIKREGILPNIWFIDAGYMRSSKDAMAYSHPAIFPEKLAHDHIYSWSNEGDIVLDYFAGSGTTAKMARALNRQYIGGDISLEYVKLARKRLQDTDPYQATELSNGMTQRSLFEVSA